MKNVKVLIYGEKTDQSRAFLTALKKKFDLVETLEAKELEDGALAEKVYGQDLFESGKKLIVVEGLPKAEFIEAIRKAPANTAIWTDEKVNAKRLKEFDGFVKKIFEEVFPINAFSFADRFFARELANSIRSFEDVINQKIAFEIIVGALNFRLRQIRLLKDGAGLDKLKSYQLQKLKKMSSLWSKEELEKLYAELINLDEGVKSGKIKNESGMVTLIISALSG